MSRQAHPAQNSQCSRPAGGKFLMIKEVPHLGRAVL